MTSAIRYYRLRDLVERLDRALGVLTDASIDADGTVRLTFREYRRVEDAVAEAEATLYELRFEIQEERRP
jgi:plasmid replication initiation protein